MPGSRDRLWGAVALVTSWCVLAPAVLYAQEPAAETPPPVVETPPAAEIPPAVEPAPPAPVDPEENDEPPPVPPGTTPRTPRYVVWRIKPGTGAGALAPRLERRLRKEMEARIGGEVLSKAAQTGILLIRPELADCDANLPCALEVAEALHIRFIVGGEAVADGDASRVTAWVIDRDTGTEVKRVTAPITGNGEAPEQAAVAVLADGLLAQPRLEEPAPVTAAAEAPRSFPTLGVAVLGTAGLFGALGVFALLGSAGAALSSAGLYGLTMQFHTSRLERGTVGALLVAGGLLAAGLILGGFALPAAVLGGVSMVRP